jgi:CheY-like chemotaxis protein
MSRTYAKVLVLENDPEQRRALVRLVRDLGYLEPMECGDPVRACRLLEVRDSGRHLLNAPILALVDLDVSDARTHAGAHDVLKRLRHEHPSCLVLVHSARVDSIDEQQRVYEQHPRALFASKRHGPEMLRRRLRDLLTGRVADLALEGGTVIHLPSRERSRGDPGARIKDHYSHEVAVKLMMCKLADRSVWLGTNTLVQAACRFRNWLGECGSPVRVDSMGRGQYRLFVPEEVGKLGLSPASRR